LLAQARLLTARNGRDLSNNLSVESATATLALIDLRLFHEIIRSKDVSPTDKIRALLRGVGTRKIGILKMAREAINNAMIEAESLPPGRSVFDDLGRIQPDYLPPETKLEEIYKTPSDQFERVKLLEESENKYFDPTFPAKLSFALRHKMRPKFELHVAPGGCLLAKPDGFQIYSFDQTHFYTTASPFCYTNWMLDAPVVDVSDDLLYIGDIFDGTSFCHFLLDWLTRLALFRAMRESERPVTVIAGGVPTPFHTMVVDAAAKLLGVDVDKVIFPSRPTKFRTRGSAMWFATAAEINTHPAHLMHPAAVEFIRALSRDITSDMPTAPKRHIYISRADAAHRRIVNEEAIKKELVSRDFQILELARMPVKDQISSFASAETIVGPHGMGFTHLAFSRTAPRIVEIHNPETGTDAYAILARSMSHDYRYLLGDPVSGSDINLDVSALITAMDDA